MTTTLMEKPIPVMNYKYSIKNNMNTIYANTWPMDGI